MQAQNPSGSSLFAKTSSIPMINFCESATWRQYKNQCDKENECWEHVN